MAVLVFTIYQMMRFESSIREEKKIKLYVEDETKPLLYRLSDEDIIDKALNSDYYFAVGQNYFKRLIASNVGNNKNAKWENIFIKGVNMGVALPGKFPAESSLPFNKYLEWLVLISGMNANTIRVYTILPPEFYEALAFYNLHYDDKPLYLLQGIWTELPVNNNFYEPDFIRGFQKEIIDVVDVIHGKAVLKEHPGKASGVYSADISKYVAGLLLGREWEPSTVHITNQLNASTQYFGDFVCMNNGNPMEAWLAEMMDFMVMYETQSYQFQHPVSFVNWLPLDPIYHNSEIIESNKVREYDNDLESIDFTKFHRTNLFFPGIYASYHVYPYYPDFIYLQNSYKDISDNGKDDEQYYHYLKDLKQHTLGMPLLIAEYGLPSSRGNSHFTPSGFNQGGHSEAEQAKLSLILTEDIVNSGCGGAVFFEWIDEWFKHNWLIMDFEQPAERRHLWHNMENPEENFGVCAIEDKIKTIDGITNDWSSANMKNKQTVLSSDADATYYYLAARIPGFNFDRNNLYLAIDTYSQEKGDHKLPFSNKLFSNGFEFLLQFDSKDSAYILVDEPYSVFTDIYNGQIPVYASQNNNNGNFVHQLLITNRSRISLLGQKSDSVIFDRSRLIFGNSLNPEYSNADWFYNSTDNFLEVRLDWHLLNVCDPSKRYVLDDLPGTDDIEYAKSEAFKILLFVTDKNGDIISQYPEDAAFSSTWDEWETPKYNQRLKPIYFTLSNYFKNVVLPRNFLEKSQYQDESFRITDYFNNKKAAISISFDNAGYSQYQYGLPVLTKYKLPASFGVAPGLLNEASQVYDFGNDAALKRLNLKEVKEIASQHEIAYQPIGNQKITQNDVLSFNQKLNLSINTLQLSIPLYNGSLPKGLIFVRKSPSNGILRSEYQGIKYLVTSSNISQIRLNKLINSQESQWTIILYHHIFNEPGEIPAQVNKNKIQELFVRKTDFEKQIRLIRNSDYWIETEANVFKYLKEKMTSTIHTNRFNNIIFLKLVNNLDLNIYNQPLTVEFRTQSDIIKIKGSETDGTYSVKNGVIIFNAIPNKEITIEIIE